MLLRVLPRLFIIGYVISLTHAGSGNFEFDSPSATENRIYILFSVPSANFYALWLFLNTPELYELLL